MHMVRHMDHDTCMGHDLHIWDMTYIDGPWVIHMGHESYVWDMTYIYEIFCIHVGHDLYT